MFLYYVTQDSVRTQRILCTRRPHDTVLADSLRYIDTMNQLFGLDSSKTKAEGEGMGARKYEVMSLQVLLACLSA